MYLVPTSPLTVWWYVALSTQPSKTSTSWTSPAWEHSTLSSPCFISVYATSSSTTTHTVTSPCRSERSRFQLLLLLLLLFIWQKQRKSLNTKQEYIWKKVTWMPGKEKDYLNNYDLKVFFSNYIHAKCTQHHPVQPYTQWLPHAGQRGAGFNYIHANCNNIYFICKAQ